MTNDKLLKELRQRLQTNIKIDWNDPHNEGWDPDQWFCVRLLELIEEEWTEGLGRTPGNITAIQNTYQSAVEGAYKDQADAADTMLIAVCGYSIESLRSIVRGKKQDKE